MRTNTHPNIYGFSVTDVAGQEHSLTSYADRVLLITNTASGCGFTPQYDDLQRLYQRYEPEGFVVLAFPCNQFGQQEPGTNEEITAFCRLNHGVTFPVFAKIDVNGTQTHPLFAYLKKQAPGLLGSQAIKWNFTKFLVSREGKVLARYAPATPPRKIAPAIEAALAR